MIKRLWGQAQARTRALYITVALALAAAGLAPLAVMTPASASAQLTARSITLSTAVTSATSVTYGFGFTLATTGPVQGLKFQACTTALSTCTAPTGLSFSSRTFSSQTGWTQATNFAVDTTGANDCTPSASVICANRTAAGNETAGARTITFGTITNPSGASCSGNPNCTFFIRINTYSTNNYTAVSIVDNGTVAASTTQTLTIVARVQEVLNFCIGTTAVDDATTSPGADCSAISGTTVDLGVLDSSTISISPVAASSGGNTVNGVAMLKTNASNGASVTYRAIQQSGTFHQGALRVLGATCNAGNINTDQCIDSAGTTQTTFTAGNEKFGMTIGGVNCGSTTAYTCNFSAGTYNLTRNAQYDGNGANTYGTSQGFAWREDGNTDQIASSTGAVDDEALILKFAATPNIITPTGSYQAQGDFIVVATY